MGISLNEATSDWRDLADRIQRFLDRTERLTRWHFDHIDLAIDALLSQDCPAGEESMLRAEEPHVFRAPTDFDGGNGSAAWLREKLLKASARI